MIINELDFFKLWLLLFRYVIDFFNRFQFFHRLLQWLSLIQVLFEYRRLNLFDYRRLHLFGYRWLHLFGYRWLHLFGYRRLHLFLLCIHGRQIRLSIDSSFFKSIAVARNRRVNKRH